MEFTAIIKDGKIVNRIAARNFFESLPDGDHRIISKSANAVSNNARGYYRGVICKTFLALLRDSGWDWIRNTDDVNEYLKSRFLRVDKENKQTGEIVTVTGSSTNVSSAVYNQFIEDCRKHAAEDYGVYIPEPNEQAKLWPDSEGK